ncbi:VOC family protein [Kribbella sp. NBC_01510]|uniref:VOC family protein n=1 Tax=Kribbella sp. NBC_01510 TaxID=2903581 RepID=UPI00386AF57F
MSLDDAAALAAAEPGPRPGQENPAEAGRPGSLSLASAVMFVTELDRAVAFYTELLAWTIAVRDLDAALLTCPDGFQLYLRRRGPRAPHSLGHIGVQYLIWTAPSQSELDRCERVLRQQSAQVTRSTLDGFTLVEGRGPDHAPILIAYPGPQEAPRHQVMQRIYRW